MKIHKILFPVWPKTALTSGTIHDVSHSPYAHDVTRTVARIDLVLEFV